VLVGKRQNVGYRFLGFLSRVGTTDRLPLPVGAKHSGRRLTILNLRSCHVGLGCLRGGSQHAPNESLAPLSGRGFLLFGFVSYFAKPLLFASKLGWPIAAAVVVRVRMRPHGFGSQAARDWVRVGSSH
jgi:hypothetical protein